MLSSSLPSLSPSSRSIIPPLQIENFIINQEEAKEVQCAICLQILNKPRQCKNGHLFCMNCILRVLEKNSQCPACRCKLTEETLSRSIFVEKFILNLKMHCKYFYTYSEETGWVEDPEGCKEVVTLETRLAHEQICGYAPVSCKYDGSCGKQRRMNQEEHEKRCIWRIVSCEFCSKDVKFCLLEEHHSKCPVIPVACPSCSKEVQRGHLKTHLKKECEEEEIECEFAEQGCDKKLLRKYMCEHLHEDVGRHMFLLKRALDDRVEGLRKEFESALKEKDKKIKQLGKAVKDSQTKIIWKIKNFSSQRRKSYLQSDKFTFAEFNWFIGFYTDGDNEESRGYFSIYLFLDVGHIPKGKSAKIEYFLTFVNHNNPSETVKKEFKTTFPIKGGQGWGDRKAVLASKIDSANGFLKGDILVIECELSVKKINWIV